MTSSWSLNNWQQQQQRQKQEKKPDNAETTSLDSSLDEWMRTQPLSILQLDPADRIVLKIADERDAIQKKTFTKWVNKHLKKAGKNVQDLFLDLQDGHNLVSLLEVLSGETLKREKGRMRIHRLQNVQTCLDFLESKNVKLVNIQASDITDGNPKLTLGLIWSIILHFQVSEITREEESGLTAKDALMQWARRVTEGYPGVNVRDMTASWRDGLAFNAILHKYRPDLINWREVRSRMNTRQRLDHAFGLAEREFGVTRLLDPEDVEVQAPDERSMLTYISTLYDALPDRPAAEKYDRDINEYRLAAREFLQWVIRTTRTMQDRSLPFHVTELKQLLNEIERFKATELPPRLREKQHLEQIYLELENLFGDTAFIRAIEDDLTAVGLDRAWNQLLAAISEREQLVLERHGLQGTAQDISRRLAQDIGTANDKLDVILTRIEETESLTRVTSPRQLKEIFDSIIYDLNLMEAPVDGYFRDVETLKSTRHPQANEFYKQVFGLHQRRVAYLERCGVVVSAEGKFVTMRSDFYMSEEYFYSRETLFKTVEESIEWIDRKLKELSEMPFVEDLKVLEENMEKHKVEHRDVMDFRVRVDQCIAHQAKISAEDSGPYCDLLHSLEEGYAQLRELSTGRVLDLDSLIAFIRAAQIELLWINEREELEVSRNWSDVGQLDLPMLQNYYKQLMHEIELREEQFNAVHNQGAALINQGHPAVYVIEAYLTTMQAQWDWLLSLTQCLEIHLQDALNLQQFVEDAQNCEQWMEKQMQLISTHYDRGDFSLDEGERLLRELEEIREMLDRYHDILLSLIERSRIISPLWQRGERIVRPLPVGALCNYQERNIAIRKNDECTLVDNSDMIKWLVRTPEGVEGVVPSVVFRLPPPDERLLSFLQRLQAQFDRLRRSWTERQRMVRFTMILNTMRTIRAWDLKQFMALDPEQREAIIKALNDDTSKLLAELDPNDPLALRLRDELRLTNEHFYKLLQAAQRGPEPELSDKFDEKIMVLLQRLEEAWRTLNDRVALPLPRDLDLWEKQIHEHKAFEDSLQALDSDVSMVHELFRQLKEPSPMQRARMDQLLGRWEDLWDLSRMFAERLKALELVLNGLSEASQIVAEHEITLASFVTMPARLDELRGVHSQLLEIQLILQQQQPIMDDLATNVGLLRQHVARTRFNVADHPDVDRLEDEVQRVTVRWENICMQVIERLKSAELSLQSLMIYRSAYETEVTWLDRVEATIRQLRNPEDLRPEEYQEHLDILLAEYAHLNERTQAMENVNLEGGKYIRDARVYDIRLSQYKDILEEVHKGIDSLIRRTTPPPTPGADVVAKELEELNKRFAQLSSFIYQRRNDLQLLMQKYQQKQLDEIGEKYASCGDSIDGLLSKIRGNRETLIQQLLGAGDVVDGPGTASSDFKSGISLVREKENLHRSLEEEVKRSMKTAEQLSSAEGAAVLSPEEFHNLRKRSDALKREYGDESVRLEKVLNRLTVASNLKDQFDAQATAFRVWMESTNGSLDQLLCSVVDQSQVALCQKESRELTDDVSGHRSELDAITNLARQIQDEVKGYSSELLAKEGIASDIDVPALAAVKGESEALVSSWQVLKDRCQLSHHQLEDAKNFFILYGQLKSWLNAKGKLVAVMGPVGVDTRLIDNQLQQIQVLLDECDSHKHTLDEFIRCGTSLVSAQKTPEAKQPVNDKIGEISEKWNDLIDRLNEKKSGLSTEIDMAAAFRRQQSELKSWVEDANDRIEKFLAVAPTASNVEQRVAFIRELQAELEMKAQDLAECENTADRLAAVSENPGIRADIKSKLQAVRQPFDDMKKKLGNLQNAVDRFLSEGNEIGRQVDGILSWVKETKTKKDKFGPISANEDKLRTDFEKFEEIYRDVLDHEVEVGLVKRRGAEVAEKNDDTNLKRKVDDIGQLWDPLLEWARNRRSRVDGAVNVESQYKRALGTFVPHLTEAEEELALLRSTPRAITVQNCEKDASAVQEFRNKIASYTHEWTSVEHLGEELIKCTDSDHLDVQDKTDKLRDRWHVLGKSARKLAKDRDAQLRALVEFNQSAAETGSSIVQCQEHVLKAVDSHSSADLDKLKTIVDGLLVSVQTKFVAANEVAKNVKERSNAADDFSEVDNTLSSLEGKISDLRSHADGKVARMEAASSSVSEIKARISSLDKDLQNLSTEFEKMGPLARDPEMLVMQMKLTEDYLTTLKTKSTDFDETKAAIDDLRNRGYPSDAAICDTSLDRSRDVFNGLKSKSETRSQELRKLSGELGDLLRETDMARGDILRAASSDVLDKPLSKEGEDISSQLHVLQVFKDGLEPLFGTVDSLLGRGRFMIKSASPGVDTTLLEKETDKLSSSLFDLRTKIAEREKQLDNAGTYQDSLNSLLSWLAEQEGAIGISPSADPKVLKAQIEAQKFLQKLINDKQPSINSFKKSAESVAQRASPEERENLLKQANEIGERYDSLVNGAKEKRDRLQGALELAEQWADDYPPLLSWLDNAERRLQKEYVSIDAERMASQIDDHKNLHEEIEGHRPIMDNVIELGTHLRDMVADDEADQLDQQLIDLATRYDQLGAKSVQVEEDLLRVAQGLDDFLSRTDELGIWLDDVGAQLERFDALSALPDTLQEQTQELMTLGEEINDQQQKVSEVIEEGRELCKHARGDEAVALQGKLDGLRWKYSELSKTVDKKLGMVQEIMPLAETFEYSNKALGTWLGDVESDLDKIDDASLDEKHALISNIEHDIKEFRPVLGDLTISGARLSQLCPGDQTALADGVVARTQKRFENVEDQVRKKSEQLSRLMDVRGEVVANMDDLIDWFQKAEAQILEAGAAPAEPDAAKKQLQDQKLLHADVASQRARGRETLNLAKKLLKDVLGDDAQAIEDKIEVLKELSDNVHQLSSDRMNVLEQAVPLAEHFDSTRNDIGKWLDVIENELEAVPSVVAGLHPEQLRKHLDHNKALQDSIQENKPLLDSLNKSGSALSQLCNTDDSNAINDALDQMNARFESAREQARSRGHVLNDALQQSLEVSDQLDNMLDSLAITVDKVRHPEPVAVHPDRIREQVQDNSALMDELEQKHDAYNNVLAAADDILRKADPSDPAVSEIKNKMDTLSSLWNEILSATDLRGRKLDEVLVVAEKFWDELRSCEEALKTLQQRLDTVDPPACEPEAVEAQRADLAEVEAALHEQAPKIDACRQTGQQLLQLVGEPEKPELQLHLDGLNNAWETVTAAFHRRHDDLIEAMEKAMNFHEMLGDVTAYLSNAEQRLHSLEPISSNLLELQEQIEEITAFKDQLDQQSVVVQQLNQECDHLAEGRSSEQAIAIKRPMQELNRRWDQLASGVRQRRDKLDEAYVKAGHFQQALDQVLDWIEKSDKTLDEIRPVPGDLKQIEIEIAKHKVLQNDVHSRQTSVDTLNDAGRKLLAAHADADPKGTQQKLDTLNTSWTALLDKLVAKGLELESCKGEAAKFGDQVQYWLHWLADVEDFLSASKAVGGLPETTREQLDNFMVLYEEMKGNQPKIEETLRLGDDYTAKSPENAASALAQHVKTLKQRWDTALTKASDRKVKLEIAYTDALEFDELMKQFVEWLVNAEQYLNGLLPVSRLMEGIESQMTEHTQFRDEVNAERAVALELNEKGTKLKYYCQKQDVILIKNLLVSTQHRWDKVVSRTADRTKQLDHAYADVREFHVLWKELCDWCGESLRHLEEARTPGRTNKAEKIRENLNQHKEFQKELGNRQPNYDTAMKLGKQLKDHAPKSEQPVVQDMLNTLRDKWNALCNRSIDRQRELEEDLLFAGQFKEAVDGLLKWLAEVEPTLSTDTGVHGDIDTVTGLVDRHKNFMTQLKAREATVETVRKAGEELMRAGENPEVEGQLAELNTKWGHIKTLAADKEARLADAKAVAEKFYHGAHATLEWLSDMETKVKYAGAIPDDEEQLTKQLQQLEKLQEELTAQKAQLGDVLALGNDILGKCHPDAVQPMKQWLVILQARWDEVASWAQERESRLKDQLNALREQDELLDSLMAWLTEKEAYLQDLEPEAIPEDLPLVEHLIEEHAQFEETLRSRQPDFDEATKGRRRQDQMEQSQGKDTKAKKPRRAIDRGRNPKVQQVSEKFSHVWLMSLDRKRKLDEMLNHLRELRKMRDFNFDDWRRRYTAWMNNKKSRVMDFFRRQDKDGDGKVTREEFIEGILQSKFPTTRMEMNAVADIFDKDGDGYIDYREFINALRPDRETTQPKTDSQRIKTEVQKQAQLCTCRKKYEIQEVGEGKYRFGEQLRLVRILRSTVMVRVGGGWVALDEFLVKNDPCRAKGRTNIELREKFILAEGVSQTMLPFKSKNPRGGPAASHASSSSGSSMASPYVSHQTHDHHHHHRHTPGPIIKVREKTERSMPMSKSPRTPHHQNGTGGSSADSEVSGILSTSRRSSADLLSPDVPTPGGPRQAGRVNGSASSRPSSRGVSNIPQPTQSSRPPSRAGSDISDISLRSHDSLSAATPSKIPSARKRSQK